MFPLVARIVQEKHNNDPEQILLKLLNGLREAIKAAKESIEANNSPLDCPEVKFVKNVRSEISEWIQSFDLDRISTRGSPHDNTNMMQSEKLQKKCIVFLENQLTK